MFQIFTIAVTTLILVGLFLSSPALAYTIAESDESLNGDIILSPAKVELSLLPGEKTAITLSVINRHNQSLRFGISAEDIVPSLSEDSAVSFLGEENGHFPFKNFVDIEISSFELDPGEEIRFNVSIRAPEEKISSGMYGGIFITASLAESAGGTTVRSRLGSLFFVRVGNNFLTTGQLKKFFTVNHKQIFWSGPISFVVTSENTGEVHLNPYGGISFRNWLGKLSWTQEIKPWFVLPGATRSRVVSAGDAGWKFGYYTATLELNRGYEDVIDRATVGFWVIAWQWMAIIGALIVALFSFGFCRRFKTA